MVNYGLMNALDMRDAWFIPTLELLPIGRVQAQGRRADDRPATYGLLIAGGLNTVHPPRWVI